jgi:hypothetical protein
MILQPVAGRGGSSGEAIPAVCSASESVGDVVYVSGDFVGGIAQVRKVDIDDAAKRMVIGVIESKSGLDCVVRRSGRIDSVYAGLTPGSPLFVNSSARLTHVVPARPLSGSRLAQSVGVTLSSTTVLVELFTPIILTA